MAWRSLKAGAASSSSQWQGRKTRQQQKLPACAELWGAAVDVCPCVKKMLWKVVECVLPWDVSQGQGPRRVTLGKNWGSIMTCRLEVIIPIRE